MNCSSPETDNVAKIKGKEEKGWTQATQTERHFPTAEKGWPVWFLQAELLEI